jgi:hypothetical protein
MFIILDDDFSGAELLALNLVILGHKSERIVFSSENEVKVNPELFRDKTAIVCANLLQFNPELVEGLSNSRPGIVIDNYGCLIDTNPSQTWVQTFLDAGWIFAFRPTSRIDLKFAIHKLGQAAIH